MTGWINTMAVMEPTFAEPFARIVEDQVSGLDATYWVEDRLGVELPTEEDEALFRLALLDESTADDIQPVGERSYIVPVWLSGEVRFWIEHGLFDGAATALTVASLELRDASALRALRAALAAEPSTFEGRPPDLVVV